MDLPVRVKADRHKVRFLSPIAYCLGCHQTVLPTVRMYLPSSNNQIKKISPRDLGFSWF